MIQIAIASVLKPVKDARAYYKMALSLREKSKYSINIIGFSTKNETFEKNIKFSQILNSKKNLVRRLLSNLKVLRILKKQKPDILIVTTWELLPVSCLGKWFWNYRLIYDVQENYTLNVLWNQPENKKPFFKWIQKGLIRVIEHTSIPSIDHFLLAERCYEDELPKFKPFTFLPNTFSGKEIEQKCIKLSEKKTIHFLLTGTLTPVYGLIDGIYWFKSLANSFPDARLSILGHCPSQKIEQDLIDFVNDDSRISLTTSQNPIPYQEILNAYTKSDIVILPYHQIPSISPKIPSKIYECLALKKPMIYSKNPLWDELIKKHQAGIGINFKEINKLPELIEKILSIEFYSTERIPESLWKTNELKFLNLIQSIEPQYKTS